jgi:hypothetical protein
VLGYEKLRAAQTLVRDRRRMISAESAGLRAGMPDAEAVARLLADSGIGCNGASGCRHRRSLAP